jgi:hypothetical protein
MKFNSLYDIGKFICDNCFIDSGIELSEELKNNQSKIKIKFKYNLINLPIEICIEMYIDLRILYGKEVIRIEIRYFNGFYNNDIHSLFDVKNCVLDNLQSIDPDAIVEYFSPLNVEHLGDIINRRNKIKKLKQLLDE